MATRAAASSINKVVVELLGGSKFYTVNDDVMGGKSTSELSPSPSGGLVFSGTINTQGGGFASCRSDSDDQSLRIPFGANVLVLQVKGDGKQYKVLLSDGTRGGPFARSPTYQHDIPTTPGESTELLMRLDDFKPSLRGRLSDDPADAHLVPGKMVQVGFMLSMLDASCLPNPGYGEGHFPFAVTFENIEFKTISG
mmetsp:Transcript_48463/g.97508  ORF Transcript_48463/g.97508 Transcript_48463/m.97508 type:complete len:196 (-) Transcript_48463:139-726(-)|eukprot:CAMPEP_0171609952 /NCGR_PEP_ID=MMETSP0990-20121206/9768_1 /TAXON_ID=483369 /ORGANISM="non described non described, Strain CCMP2098" /LENGTH=195 /DNA_ID=CAMNT_0012173285 /DNA_START=1 /DNA_END=588 /DNA_ORIENTATION=-